MTTFGRFVLPTSGSGGPQLLVDTSVALALIVANHEAKDASRAVVAGRRIGLSGHAAFETYSVVTRLPAPRRRSPEVVTRLLAANFPFTRYLGEADALSLLAEFSDRGISGGAVYDGLVAAAARAHGVPLVTRDQRALRTYRALDVEVMLIND